MIRQLPNNALIGVWEIISDGIEDNNDKEIEIDIDQLPIRKTRELERYVKKQLNY